MVERFDEGRIIKAASCKLEEIKETAHSLNRKLLRCFEELFSDVVLLWLNEGLPTGLEQPKDFDRHPYHFRNMPFDGIMDESWDDSQKDRFIRACFMPPFDPALCISPSGKRYLVQNMDEYRELRRCWEVSPSPNPSLQENQ